MLESSEPMQERSTRWVWPQRLPSEGRAHSVPVFTTRVHRNGSAGISRSWRARLLHSLFGSAVPFSRSLGKPPQNSFPSPLGQDPEGAKPRSSPCHAEQSFCISLIHFPRERGIFLALLSQGLDVGCLSCELGAEEEPSLWFIFSSQGTALMQPGQ